jgi:stage II sporulation protein D
MLLTSTARAVDGPTVIRVRLFEENNTQRVTLRAEAPLRLTGAGRLSRLEPGAEVVLSVRDGRVLVDERGASEIVSSLSLTGAFTLTLPGGGRLARRRYEGDLRVEADPARTGALRLVHAVEMETYVAGVVQREYGMDDLEGSKAMAVAARTYALRSRGRFGRDYDVVDNISAQVFFGLEGVGAVARQAAETTRGEVLLHGGSLIEAVYSASSGGYTADNDGVWGTAPVSYLRARPDPFDASASPHARWTTRVPREALLQTLGRSLNVPVEGFALADVGSDGRVGQVNVLLAGGRTQTISTARFRSIVNGAFGGMSLRSTRFSHRLESGESVFEGSGFGHGVGLSQWGARGQALAGRSYREILGFYYPGTTLAVLGSDFRLPLPSSSEPFARPILAAAEAEPAVEDPGFTTGLRLSDAGSDAAVDAALDRLRSTSAPAPRPQERTAAPVRGGTTRTVSAPPRPAADTSAAATVQPGASDGRPVLWSTPAAPRDAPARRRGAW